MNPLLKSLKKQVSRSISVSLVLKCNRPEEVNCHRLCAVFSETEIISRISHECFDRARRFNHEGTQIVCTVSTYQAPQEEGNS